MVFSARYGIGGRVVSDARIGLPRGEIHGTDPVAQVIG